MIWFAALTIVVLGFAAGAVVHMQSARQKKRQFEEPLHSFCNAAPEARAKVIEGLLAQNPVSAVARYLQGCQCLREGRSRDAARAFGAAHHADCNIETAALLTFASLKAGAAEPDAIIEQIVITWEEMKRPDVLARPEDRFLIDHLEATTRKAPRLSVLGRLAWITASPAQQARLEQLAETRPNWANPLFQDH